MRTIQATRGHVRSQDFESESCLSGHDNIADIRAESAIADKAVVALAASAPQNRPFLHFADDGRGCLQLGRLLTVRFRASEL